MELGDFYLSSKILVENKDLEKFIESETEEKLSDEMREKIAKLSPNEKELILKNIAFMEDNNWFGMSKEQIKETLEIMLIYPSRKLNGFNGQNSIELYRFLAEEAIYECFRPEFSKEA